MLKTCPAILDLPDWTYDCDKPYGHSGSHSTTFDFDGKRVEIVWIEDTEFKQAQAEQEARGDR